MDTEVNSTALNISWSGSDASFVISYFVNITSDARNTMNTVNIDSDIGQYPNYTPQSVVFGGLFPYTDYVVVVGGKYGSGNIYDLYTVTTTVRTAEASKTNDNNITQITIYLLNLLY